MRIDIPYHLFISLNLLLAISMLISVLRIGKALIVISTRSDVKERLGLTKNSPSGEFSRH